MQPKNPVTLGILLFCILFIIVVVFITMRSATVVESALSALLLTLISVVATWVAAHFYANYTRKMEIENLNEAHEKSLRMYALKAAEKVMNLSKELDRLSEFLVAYRDAEDHQNLDVTLRIKEERVTGAIHIVHILKSVNDTTLSDWQGVIGEELSRKKEEEEQLEEKKEDYLRDVLARIEDIFSKKAIVGSADWTELELLTEDVKELKRRVNLALHAMSPAVLPLTPSKREKLVPCPDCGNEIGVKISGRGRVRVGGVQCRNCGAKLFSVGQEADSVKLIKRELVSETVACPNCEAVVSVELENIPASSTYATCGNCDHELRISRTNSGGLNVKEVTHLPKVAKESVTPAFVAKVRQLLPSQPWPSGIHKQVARELETTPSHVQKAIKVLIQAGIFKNQIDGVVVDQEEFEAIQKAQATR